jgi:hypothetical protein
MRSVFARIYYALGPLAAGIMLDLLDLATFGMVGVFVGALVGAWAGWLIGEFEGLDRDGRVAIACCAAVYMMIPMTEPLPIATLFTLVARFMRGPRSARRRLPPPDDPSKEE